MPNVGQLESLPISAAVSAYRLVSPSGDGTVAHVASAADPCIGVTNGAEATVGQPATFAINGMPLCEYGGTITAGQMIMPAADGSGKVIAVTPTASTDDHKWAAGVAIYSGVSGDIKRIQFIPHQMGDVSVIMP